MISGEFPGDIHPKNKQEVARRLVLVAGAKVYGEKAPYSGPVWQSMSSFGTGHALYLGFGHVGGGLVSKSGPALTRFEVASADGVFVPAACIMGAACPRSRFEFDGKAAAAFKNNFLEERH